MQFNSKNSLADAAGCFMIWTKGSSLLQRGDSLLADAVLARA